MDSTIDVQEATFEAACSAVAGAVSSGDKNFDNDAKLAFYGLFKQATCGPCTTGRPAFWDMTGRAKWDAWHKLGQLDKEAAMVQYIELLCKLLPSWQPATSQGQSSHRQGMGPVFSCLAAAEPEDQMGPATLHELVSKGEISAMEEMLKKGVVVDIRDENMCTALHFAADRGSCTAAELLLKHGADVNAQDEDGQTPLHYAALCGHKEVYQILLKAGANLEIKDNEGQTADEV